MSLLQLARQPVNDEHEGNNSSVATLNKLGGRQREIEARLVKTILMADGPNSPNLTRNSAHILCPNEADEEC